MDRNIRIKGYSSGASNKNKSVNKIHTKVIKHFEPTMQLHVNDAELPLVGVAQDDSYKPFSVTETCPTRVRTINKTKPRVISKQSPSNFHRSSTPKPSKLRRCTKKSSKSAKNRSPKEFDSTSYMDELKNEINQFKAFQTSLTKTADALKSEIKEFRNSNTIPLNENQTSDDGIRDYINLVFKNSGDNVISVDNRSPSLIKDSTSEHSSTSSLAIEKSSVFKTLPWNFGPSNLMFDERSRPESLNENNKEISFVSKPGPSNSFGSCKQPQISADANPPLTPNFNYSKPSQSKLVKCNRLKKGVSGTHSKLGQTDIDAHVQENELLQITTKTRSSKYQLKVRGETGKVVKRNTDSKITVKEKETLSDEKLIKLVFEHKELYDSDQINYSNIKLKKQVWLDIGEALNIPGELCKKKWRNIRDSYRKYMKDHENGKVKKRYKHADMLEFLNPFVHEKNSIPSHSNEEENRDEFKEDSINESDRWADDADDNSVELDLDDGESTIEAVQNRKKRAANESNVLLSYVPEEVNVKKTRLSEDEDDALKQLFFSMYSTLKTFPPLLQVETKMKLFYIVSNTELEYLKGKEGSFTS
ncbi:hypothetical protein FQR65_LT00537 [Abscondita terminalis]|nr:hypothetical protein FQR65_LT00537 [Abscondita terminalis]